MLPCARGFVCMGSGGSMSLCESHGHLSDRPLPHHPRNPFYLSAQPSTLDLAHPQQQNTLHTIQPHGCLLACPVPHHPQALSCSSTPHSTLSTRPSGPTCTRMSPVLSCHSPYMGYTHFSPLQIPILQAPRAWPGAPSPPKPFNTHPRACPYRPPNPDTPLHTIPPHPTP